MVKKIIILMLVCGGSFSADIGTWGGKYIAYDESCGDVLLDSEKVTLFPIDEYCGVMSYSVLKNDSNTLHIKINKNREKMFECEGEELIFNKNADDNSEVLYLIEYGSADDMMSCNYHKNSP
jgi:hypothetical protein